MKKTITILLFIFFLFFPQDIFALSIFPLRQTVVINPGESSQVELLVKNEKDETVEILPEVDAFTIDGQSGAAIFGVDDVAVSWINLSNESLVLEPGEDSGFVFSVQVPANAEPGTHYLGLFAKTIPSEGQIGVGSRVGSLLFLHVAGTIKEQLIRQDFSSDERIYFSKPVELKLKLENVGTTHVVPEGRIIVKNLFGDVVDDMAINPNKRKVVPHTSWHGEYTIESLDLKDLGPNKIQLVLNYGMTNQVITESISFWYLPTWVILSILGVFLTVIVLVMLLRHKQ
ncbi:MAG: hypothetical protein GF349_01845 [Candidatus Magasanikbacteria bacterium]|nr:hypothetical protein [Candidatus Magasanikbacteria bacterium]